MLLKLPISPGRGRRGRTSVAPPTKTETETSPGSKRGRKRTGDKAVEEGSELTEPKKRGKQKNSSPVRPQTENKEVCLNGLKSYDLEF